MMHVECFEDPSVDYSKKPRFTKGIVLPRVKERPLLYEEDIRCKEQLKSKYLKELQAQRSGHVSDEIIDQPHAQQTQIFPTYHNDNQLSNNRTVQDHFKNTVSSNGLNTYTRSGRHNFKETLDAQTSLQGNYKVNEPANLLNDKDEAYLRRIGGNPRENFYSDTMNINNYKCEEIHIPEHPKIVPMPIGDMTRTRTNEMINPKEEKLYVKKDFSPPTMREKEEWEGKSESRIPETGSKETADTSSSSKGPDENCRTYLFNRLLNSS